LYWSSAALVGIAVLVGEAVLVEALRDGHLAGAGLDGFGEEPPPADHLLFSVENALLSPHTAASTQQAMRRMGLDAARGILDILGDADALSPLAGAPLRPRDEEIVLYFYNQGVKGPGRI
jgi:phosphoglycerate dehydrogenase-like enzyme